MKKCMSFVFSMYRKYKETFWYLVFGGLTTLLNIAVFYFLRLGNVDKTIANLIAWIAGVLFAFVTNKLFVFNSREWTVRKFAWEFLTFVGARLFSGAFDMVFLHLFTGWLFNFNEMVIKIISNIIVIIMNYVFSKLIVFRKKKETAVSAEDSDG